MLEDYFKTMDEDEEGLKELKRLKEKLEDNAQKHGHKLRVNKKEIKR